ncbi:serine/threonine protein kinase [Streptomyces cyaneochromogenes]|uniref:non-specific serine/threonine protein kinase n=1 Tax=Streptomyces cyaneochromogenes TaxID=2496836 RepID=A0A3S9LZR5_9ACTN|nr:serine/threonine-protein kinase [Streptomyces cyaneochromogenes]AZQ32435.1 serine/threonine protein kinase [Streptomyces cyaneochromogenes]
MLVADRYQLDQPLGRGAIGEVWHATDQVLNRAVAVKLLRPGQTDQVAATDAERFRLEAQTAARLNHPNLVGVHDFGSHGGRLFLVMELVDGWTLAQERARRSVLPPDEAAGIAAQMAAGLAAAHCRQVIHRDIKPGNVMLTADGTVKITDFGIARFANDQAGTLTATGKIVGSAAYLSPERGLGQPAQPASDVYSLGCVLYELLTGRPPFPGTNAVAVVKQHIETAPIPPAQLRPELPHPLSDYVLDLLAKDPARRPTAEQAATWLTGYQERPNPVSPEPRDEPTTELPASSPTEQTGTSPAPAQRAHSRRMSPKALLGLAGFALLATVVAVGVSLASGDNDPAMPAPGSTPSSSAPAAPASETPSSSPPAASAPSPTPGDRKPEENRREADEERKKAEEQRKREDQKEDKKGKG